MNYKIVNDRCCMIQKAAKLRSVGPVTEIARFTPECRIEIRQSTGKASLHDLRRQSKEICMSRETTQSVAEIKARNKQLIDEVLKVYPEKTAKRRAKHLSVHEAGRSDCGVKSNIKSIPGVMTIRGCAYAGSKGVVWGPIKDMIHISHGPVGCGQYSWGSRRNYYVGTTGIDNS
ncbi:hypothetical protein ABIB88_002586 [Bradyrhizobium sp. JR19.8]